VLIAYLWGTQQLFERRGLVLSALYPVGAIGFAMIGGGVVRYLSEEREKRWIRDTFRRYLNPEVLEHLAREPERVRLGGEEREVTIFFSDIRGFTTISEALQKQAGPEGVAELMNEYLTAMTKILFEHEGLLDKYIGDAVMAFWGAPVVVPDHAARACWTALHMLDALAPLNERWRGRGWPPVAIGIGISTGEVVVGNFGSETRFNYTIFGDDVNLASRLEGLNKTYHTRILLSERTQRAVADEFVCREIDRVEVKGKHERVTIYELLGPLAADADGRWRRLAADFAEMLGAYRARDWGGAEARLARLAAEWDGDGPSAEFARRIRELRAAQPGEAWDGVYRPTEK
jgi:adenylate cyclase